MAFSSMFRTSIAVVYLKITEKGLPLRLTYFTVEKKTILSLTYMVVDMTWYNLICFL